MFWRTLGFPLQFKKGQKGPTVKWIGFALRSTDSELEISIKPEIFRELRSQIASVVKCNVISRKDLQRLAGWANHVAGMIPVWRPFFKRFGERLLVMAEMLLHTVVGLRKSSQSWLG